MSQATLSCKIKYDPVEMKVCRDPYSTQSGARPETQPSAREHSIPVTLACQGGISHSEQTLDGSGLSTLSGWVSQSWKSSYMSPGVTWRETGCQKKVALPNSLSTLGSRFEAYGRAGGSPRLLEEPGSLAAASYCSSQQDPGT